MSLATLKLETDSYQIFEVKYGVILLDRNSYREDILGGKNNVLHFKNVFMQGDDAESFLAEVEKCAEKHVEHAFVNSWLSEYQHIFESISKSDLESLGVKPKSKPPLASSKSSAKRW